MSGQTSAAPAAQSQPRGRILIAEDSATQAAHLRHLLEARGFEVMRAPNGREALAAIAGFAPDLIISDVVMPELDGYGLCRAVKADIETHDIPVILVTSLSSPGDVFKGLDAGADNFIVKPYDDRLLASRVNYVLTNRELRKSGKLQVGIEIELAGQRHFITAERQQILDLLISTYEQAVRLYDELELRQKQLTRSYETINAHYEIAEGLNRCRAEGEVAAEVIERCLRLPGVRGAWMFLRDGAEFRLAAAGGIATTLFEGGYQGGACACQGELVAGRLNEAQNVSECEMLVLAGMAGECPDHATVPLRIEEETVGILNLAGEHGGGFTAEELRTLSVVGKEIGTALERARLLESLELRVEERTRSLEREVAERREAEEAARRAHEQSRRASEALSAIFASSPAGIVACDAEGRVTAWNAAAEKIFGYGASEVMDRPLPVEPHVRSGSEYVPSPGILGGAGFAGIEIRTPRKNGEPADVLVSCAPLHDADGERRGSIYVFDDLSEHHRIEEQLRQAQKMESIGNLTGGIAHDFNNLLTIMIGNLDLVMNRTQLAPQVRDLVQGAIDAGLRGADLTRQLLAFGRRQALAPEMVDVNRLVSGMVKLLRRTLGENIEIVLREGRDLWPVLADPAQLDTAIVNLAVNARDAMPDGGTLTIETENCELDEAAAGPMQLAPGPYVVTAVTDTGCGMPAKVVAHIFEPFFTTKEAGKGSGLGLSMVYGFVRQSGGHVTVYSEPGVGTTIRLYLPRAVAGEARAQPAAGKPAPAAPGGGETVLVVEDNPAVREVVERHLADLGYRVESAANASEALAVFEGGAKIDLMFSDVVMPGSKSGIVLAGDVIARWPGVKVLLTSGFPEAALRQSGSAPGHRILSKPYRKEALAEAIRAALDS